MVVFKLIIKHQTVVSVTETFFKIASTHRQKWLTIFCQNAQNFVYFGPYDFVQISTACGPNTYQIMYGETLNLPSKLFPTAVANADIGSLKSLHTFL